MGAEYVRGVSAPAIASDTVATPAPPSGGLAPGQRETHAGSCGVAKGGAKGVAKGGARNHWLLFLAGLKCGVKCGVKVGSHVWSFETIPRFKVCTCTKRMRCRLHSLLYVCVVLPYFCDPSVN